MTTVMPPQPQLFVYTKKKVRKFDYLITHLIIKSLNFTHTLSIRTRKENKLISAYASVSRSQHTYLNLE